MILSNDKMMLIYGFSDEDKQLMDSIIKNNQLPSYKVIEKSMARMKIRDLINNLKLDTYIDALPDEKVILFNNFTDKELDAAINAIRSNSSIKPILAVVTPTSIDWEFKYLLEHLIEEREWYKNNKS